MKQVEGKRRSARWPKKMSSGTRPGTATMRHPVVGDAEANEAVEKLRAGAVAKDRLLALEEGAPDIVLLGAVAPPFLVDGVVRARRHRAGGAGRRGASLRHGTPPR